MTEAQAAQTLQAHGAAYKGMRDGIQWFWTRRRTWIGKVVKPGGEVELKEVQADCGCTGGVG